MQYMIIERFYPDRIKQLYEKFDREGRLLPQGVTYVNSWINETVTICYQVMESETREQLQQWIDNWKGFADFEVIPVIASVAAKEKVLSAKF